jgi:ubiquinone/menaquinone biosynthesis C-methylase UbiE
MKTFTRRSFGLAGGVAALAATLARNSSAQEKSVRPGINDNFKNPNVEEWVARLETESREPYARRNEIVAATGVKPRDIVADVGAGTGLFTAMFAGKVGSNGHVFAIDIAASFLQHISNVAARQKIENICPVLCQQDSITLPANIIDVAFVCDTYHHFEFPQKTLASIHRALRPQGRLIIVEFIKIPGVTPKDRMDHVRASQEVVEKEVAAAGFRKIAQPGAGLKENYIDIFQRV